MAWTEERVEILKERWGQGLPAAKIAEELGDVTRNAVIGKIFRLGLSNKARKRGAANAPDELEPAEEGTPDVSQIEAVQEQTAGADSQELTESAAEDEAPDGPQVKAEDAVSDIATARLAEEASPKLNLMQLTEKTCKWPIGDPSKAEFWFCGHPSQPGKPYCEPHNKIAAQPFTSKRDKKIQRPQDLSTFSRRQ